MKFVVMSILIALLSISLLQAGTIKGLIKDADTGDPLIGANLVLGLAVKALLLVGDGAARVRRFVGTHRGSVL